MFAIAKFSAINIKLCLKNKNNICESGIQERNIDAAKIIKNIGTKIVDIKIPKIDVSLLNIEIIGVIYK